MNKETLDNLVAEINLTDVNGINFTPESIVQFGDTVGDYNQIHRDPKAAQDLLNFPDTPVIGVHLASIGGRIGEQIESILQRKDPLIRFIGQTIDFKKPTFPGLTPQWKINSADYNPDNQTLNVAMNASKDGETKVDVVSRFGYNPDKFTLASPRLYSQNVALSQEDIDKFYKLIGQRANGRIANLHPASLVPSTLLTFLKELNAINGTKFGGANLSMGSSFYSFPEIGNARVDIYQTSKKGKGSRCIYEFDGILYQDDKARSHSRIKCLTNGELDTSTLQANYRLA